MSASTATTSSRRRCRRAPPPRSSSAAGAPSLPGNLIAVDDPLQALGALATFWRGRFDIPVAVVTGSNGKTTTKEMIAAIFRAAAGDAAVAATPGNFNNAIGLPLALLALRATHRLAVFEIGMNHRGETRELAAIAQPTIAVITNAQREHQEFMRSVDDVADEHADAIARCARTARRSSMPTIRARTCGVPAAAARRARGRHVRSRPARRRQRAMRRTPTAARSSSRRRRATRTSCCARPAGTWRAMRSPRRPPRCAAASAAHGDRAGPRGVSPGTRDASRRAATPAGATVIDDTYNANPDSVRAAIDVLAARPRPRWLVLGDMGEVGDEGPAFHREIGAYARESGVERMLAAGALAREAARAFGAGAEHFASVDALAQRVAADARAGVTVLVKGSRFMRMERVVAALTGQGRGGAH